MLRVTRRRVRLRVRLLTPAALVGVAGRPGFANAVDTRPPETMPAVAMMSAFTNLRRCICVLLAVLVGNEVNLGGAFWWAKGHYAVRKVRIRIPAHENHEPWGAPFPFGTDGHLAR